MAALIVQYSGNRSGSGLSGLLLANGLRETGWQTHVAFGFEGPMVGKYEEAGHISHLVPHKSWLRRKGTPQFLKDLILELRKAWSFIRLIDRVQPDIIYLTRPSVWLEL